MNSDLRDTPYHDLPDIQLQSGGSGSGGSSGQQFWCPDAEWPQLKVPVCKGIDYNTSQGALLEQLDQHITLTMQRIDSNLAAVCAVVSGRLVPALKSYRTATGPVRDTSDKWIRFFEAAAHIKIPHPYNDNSILQDASRDIHSGSILHSGADEDSLEGDASVQYANSEDGDASMDRSHGGAGGGGGMSSASLSIASPFEQLKSAMAGRDLAADFSIDSAAATPIAYRQQHHQQQHQGAFMPKVGSTPKPLLHKVLKKNINTPKAAGNPYGGKGWDGLVDIRSPASSSNISIPTVLQQLQNQEDEYDSDDDANYPPGWSPLRTAKFTVQSPAKAVGRTPAKDAAKAITQQFLHQASMNLGMEHSENSEMMTRNLRESIGGFHNMGGVDDSEGSMGLNPNRSGNDSDSTDSDASMGRFQALMDSRSAPQHQSLSGSAVSGSGNAPPQDSDSDSDQSNDYSQSFSGVNDHQAIPQAANQRYASNLMSNRSPESLFGKPGNAQRGIDKLANYEHTVGGTLMSQAVMGSESPTPYR